MELGKSGNAQSSEQRCDETLQSVCVATVDEQDIANSGGYINNSDSVEQQLVRRRDECSISGEVIDVLGYLHWQLFVVFDTKRRLRAVRDTFGPWHAEPTRSEAARTYCWKDETSVKGTRFELGKYPFRHNSKVDWDAVRSLAKCGKLDDIPSSVYVRSYFQLRRIATDNLVPVGIERQVTCYWGSTGTGKSRTAWEQAGENGYPKDPRTKFWDGYRGQENVVMDEFRGGIDVSHMLRWLDRYPVIIEVKGSSTVLYAKRFFITSNLDPRLWYPDIDDETRSALLRRMTIVYFPKI